MIKHHSAILSANSILISKFTSIGYSAIFLYFCVVTHVSTDLVCNGDFQQSNINQTYTYNNYILWKRIIEFSMPGNSSCWYSTNNQKIFLKKVQTAPEIETKVFSTIFERQNNLCQKILLQKNKVYLLKYYLLIDSNIKQCNIQVTLNNKSLSSSKYDDTYSGRIFQQIVSLRSTLNTSNQTSNQLCFNPGKIRCKISGACQYYGFMIDNITVSLPRSGNTTILPQIPTNTTTNTTVNTETGSDTPINTTTNTTGNTTNTTTNTTTTTNTNMTEGTETTTNTTMNTTTTTTTTTNTNTTTNTTTTKNTTTTTNTTTTSSTNTTVNTETGSDTTSKITTNTTSNTTTNTSQTIIFIDFKLTQIKTYQLKLTSNLSKNLANISLHLLQPKVYIENEQQNFHFQFDENGYLKILVTHDVIYDFENLKTLRIVLQNTTQTKYVVLVNGRMVGVDSSDQLSLSEIILMKNILPVANVANEMVRDTFNLLNSFTFSYFVVSLISFYNVTLLYYFLHIKILPGFTRMFVLSLAYIFYSRGSVFDLLQRFGLVQNEFQPEFLSYGIVEKMDLYKDGQNYWFAYYGIFSNFLQTNLEPLFLLSLFVVKFCLLKVALRFLPSAKKKLNISWQQFFQQFSLQLSCFAPFFTISCITTLLNISENTFYGRINSTLQVLTLVILILVPVTCAILSLSKFQNLSSMVMMKKFRSKKVFKIFLKHRKFIERKRFVKTIDRLSSVAMSTLIPLLIVLSNKIVFFLFVTPLILWRFYMAVKSRKYFSCFENTMIISSQFLWMIYHLSYLLLFIFQSLNQIVDKETSIKYSSILGYTIVSTIILGALIDLLVSIIQIIKFLLNILRYIFKKIKKTILTKCSNKIDSLDKNDDEKKAKQTESNLNSTKVVNINKDMQQTAKTMIKPVKIRNNRDGDDNFRIVNFGGNQQLQQIFSKTMSRKDRQRKHCRNRFNNIETKNAITQKHLPKK